MADQNINIIFTAVDRASTAIDGIRGQIMSFNNIMRAAQTIMRGVQQVYNETVGTFQQYANEIRTLTQVQNQSAESMSRLYQVAGDFGITMQSLTAASRKLATEGLSLDIETMARLSDQYLTLNTGAERQQFLTDKLGSSGTAFAGIMSQGSQAILERNAAVSDSLILDQQSLHRADQLARALGDLQDEYTAVAVSIGENVVPSLVLMLEYVDKSIKGWQTYGSVMSRVTGGSGGDPAFNLKVMTDRVALLRNQMAAFPESVFFDKWQAQLDATRERISTLVVEQDNLANGMLRTASAADEAATEVADLGSQYQSITSLAQGFADTDRQIIDVEERLAAARAASHGEVTAEITDLVGQLDDLRAAQQRQTDQWVLNIVTQQLSMDGLSQTEMAYLLQYQVDTGLINEEQQARAQAAWDSAMSIAEAYASIPDETVTLTTVLKVVKTEQASTLPDIGMAGGGNFRGWAMVGDAPGGHRTPYTEWVYAPGGATVYNQAQMSGHSAPSHAMGGAVTPGEMSLSTATIHELAGAIAQKMAGYV